jgi:hypothetical protein
VTEIIDFEGKRNQCSERKPIDEGFDALPDWMDDAAWEARVQAVEKMIDNAVRRFKRKRATRFDAILALIQEERWSCSE